MYDFVLSFLGLFGGVVMDAQQAHFNANIRTRRATVKNAPAENPSAKAEASNAEWTTIEKYLKDKITL